MTNVGGGSGGFNTGQGMTEEEIKKRNEANELRRKLAKESETAREKALREKNIDQKIRLIINVITPDNFEKKFEELRNFLFPGLKAKGEPGYDPEIHPVLTDEILNLSDKELKEQWEAEQAAKEAAKLVPDA